MVLSRLLENGKCCVFHSRSVPCSYVMMMIATEADVSSTMQQLHLYFIHGRLVVYLKSLLHTIR